MQEGISSDFMESSMIQDDEEDINDNPNGNLKLNLIPI